MWAVRFSAERQKRCVINMQTKKELAQSEFSYFLYFFDYEHSSPLAVYTYIFGFRLSILHLNLSGLTGSSKGY